MVAYKVHCRTFLPQNRLVLLVLEFLRHLKLQLVVFLDFIQYVHFVILLANFFQLLTLSLLYIMIGFLEVH